MKKYKLFCMLKNGEWFIRSYHGEKRKFGFADIICSREEKIRLIIECFTDGLTHKRSAYYIPWWEIVEVINDES